MSWIDDLLALRCVGCGAPGAAVCADCRQVLTSSARTAGAIDGVPVFAATAYPPEVGRIVIGCKDGGGWGLVAPLGDAMAMAVAAALDADPGGPVSLVPIPTRRRDRFRRGGDPIGAVSRHAAGRLHAAGVPVDMAAMLGWRRRTVDQGRLAAADRYDNVRGALRAVAAAPDRAIVCDDLVTTGATAAAAIEVLRGCGTAVLAVAAVARPPAGPSTGADLAGLR